MITLREIATQALLADDADALLAWLLEHIDGVAAAFGHPVAETADALERAYNDGKLAPNVLQSANALIRRARDAKRDGAGKAMQAAVDASVTAGVIDARALLDAITSNPPGAVLLVGDHRIPLATLRDVAALRRLRGATLTARLVPCGEHGSAGGLRFEWTRPEGTRGRVTLRTRQTPIKDARGRVTGWTAVYDPDALALVLPL